MPHPGKESTHARTMLPALPHFTLLKRFDAPTPIIAVVLVCVVDTGIPVPFAKPIQKIAERQAANP